MKQTVVTLAALISAVAVVVSRAEEQRVPDTIKLQSMAAWFAPTDISADLSKLSATDRRVLSKLVEASRIVDALSGVGGQ